MKTPTQIAAEAAERIADLCESHPSLTREIKREVQSAIEKARLEIWRTAPDQPDIQEAVIRKLDLVHRDAIEKATQALGGESVCGKCGRVKHGDHGKTCYHCDQPAHASETTSPSATKSLQDTKRLDWLESVVRNEGGQLHLHNNKPADCLGLTIHNRTLREAIDAAMKEQT